MPNNFVLSWGSELHKAKRKTIMDLAKLTKVLGQVAVVVAGVLVANQAQKMIDKSRAGE